MVAMRYEYLDISTLDKEKDIVEVVIQKADTEKAYRVVDGERFYRVHFGENDRRNRELCITQERLRQYLEIMMGP